jgi:perosamine synthetase
LNDFIPVSEPLLTGNEKAYLQNCIDTGWISSEGPFVGCFERAVADWCGVRHAVAVTNGTAALHVAVGSLPFKPGDEILMPDFTIISCALAIIENGCTPVLVDSDPETWAMDAKQLQAKITARTRGVMVVNIYGHPVDMAVVNGLAARHGLYVIEDAAEGLGSTAYGKPGGALGHVAALSFYANKLISTGEGGMVLTNDDTTAENARALRNLCFRTDRRFLHSRIGHNHRMTNIQAAVGLAQMERIETFIKRRRSMGRLYLKGLSGLPVQLPAEREWASNIYWMFGLVLDDDVPCDAEEFTRRLAESNIQTRPFFLGMHEQPVLQEMGLFKGESYPVSARLARRGFYLPSGQAITDGQIERVCREVRKIFKTL